MHGQWKQRFRGEGQVIQGLMCCFKVFGNHLLIYEETLKHLSNKSGTQFLTEVGDIWGGGVWEMTIPVRNLAEVLEILRV